jgi:hypothetical protein
LKYNLRNKEDLLMAANAIPSSELKINTERRGNETCGPLTLKQSFEKLLREVFEGHEDYLGATPD